MSDLIVPGEGDNWEDILKFLEPEPPKFCPHEPFLKQKVFLRSEALEVLFGGRASGGKMVQVSTKILTTDGWTTIGDLAIGQMVFGMNGAPTTVLAKSDVETVDGWRLTFDDGSQIVACDDHRWFTYTATDIRDMASKTPKARAKRRANRPSRGTGKKPWLAEMNSKREYAYEDVEYGSVKTTSEIVATLLTSRGRANHLIPVCAPLEAPEKELPIDPYLLGIWLGDGTTAAGSITSMDPEIIQAFVDDGWQLGATQRKSNNRASTTTILGLQTKLREIGLLGNKHIPEEYLIASRSQRLALLQGLLDTDGNVSGNSVEFCNMNRNLSEGVAFLARSLGVKARVREGRAKFQGRDYGPRYTVKFAASFPCFRLPRKANKQGAPRSPKSRYRYIVSAERITQEKMQCIKVSNMDGLFLVGEDLIPTHNSDALLMGALQFCHVPGYAAMIFRNSFSDLSLPGSLMDRSHDWLDPYDDVIWHASTNTWKFPSGATLTFGYLDRPDDHLRYKGPITSSHEILSEERGWISIADAKVGERVASLDPETRTMEFHPVTRTMEFDYEDDLICSQPGADVSFETTRDHTFWGTTNRNRRDFRRFKAEDLPTTVRLSQWARWEGKPAPEFFTFEQFKRGGGHKADAVFTKLDFAELVGWFIAEGCIPSHDPAAIRISQHMDSNPVMVDRISQIFDRSGVYYKHNGRDFQISVRGLASYLKECGTGAKNKRIPRDLLNYDREFLVRMLWSLVEGDGTWRTMDCSSGHFVTTSKGLADDVMELAMRCGYRATLDERPYVPEYNFGLEGMSYHVHLHYRDGKDTIVGNNKPPFIRKPYKGKVYCVTVPPHHTVLTRHNGRVHWTGNSELQYIGFDELTEISEKHYLYMFSRLRRPSGKGSLALSKVPLRVRSASNPAPNWVRRRFIESNDPNRLYIPSGVYDNPYVDTESYLRSLENVDPVERARLRDGDWYADEEGSKFKKTDFVIASPDEIPEHVFMNQVRYWDLASTAVSPKNPDPDWTAGALVALVDGILYILDMKHERMEADGVEALVRRTAELDGPLVRIRMEKEPGSSGKATISHYARHILLGYDFDGHPTIRDKEARMNLWAGKVRRGEVILQRGAWNTEFLDEAGAYGAANVHDDQLDAVSGAFEVLSGIGGKERGRVEIIV